LNYYNFDKNFLLNEFAIKENEKIFNDEERIFYKMNKKNTVDIFKFIYEASRLNTNVINEIYNEDLLNDLKKEISKFDGFPC